MLREAHVVIQELPYRGNVNALGHVQRPADPIPPTRHRHYQITLVQKVRPAGVARAGAALSGRAGVPLQVQPVRREAAPRRLAMHRVANKYLR